MVPLMLELGMPAEVCAATSSFMILWTSLSGTVQYGLAGRIMWDYATAFACIGVLSSVGGQKVLDLVVTKYGRKSYIVLAAVAVIILSALLLFVTSVRTIVLNIQAGADMGLKSFC